MAVYVLFSLVGGMIKKSGSPLKMCTKLFNERVINDKINRVRAACERHVADNEKEKIACPRSGFNFGNPKQGVKTVQ